MRAVPDPPLNNVGIVHLEKKNWRGLLHLSIFPFFLSFRPLLVFHGMVEACFRPSRLSRADGTKLKLGKVNGGLFLRLYHSGCLQIGETDY